jgi:ABC-type amino acid transport substrate-binding protein
VATTPNAPPLSFTDPSGAFVGMWPDMSQEIARRLGLRVALKSLDFDGLLAGITAHRFDVGAGGVLQTPERRQSKAFILSVPYLQFGVTALTKEGSGLRTWQGLGGKTIGGARGEQELRSAQAYLDKIGAKPGSVVEYAGRTDGVLGLTSGRVDAFVLDSASGVYTQSKTSEGKSLSLVRPFIDIQPAGAVYAPQEKQVAKAVDGAIRKMLADGTIARLAEKWYGTSEVVYQRKAQ